MTLTKALTLIDQDISGCLLWKGQKTKAGYGVVCVKRHGKWTTTTAHRFMWEQTFGKELPRSLDLDHSCRRRHCVNPDHVEPMTHRRNLELDRKRRNG